MGAGATKNNPRQSDSAFARVKTNDSNSKRRTSSTRVERFTPNSPTMSRSIYSSRSSYDLRRDYYSGHSDSRYDRSHSTRPRFLYDSDGRSSNSRDYYNNDDRYKYEYPRQYSARRSITILTPSPRGDIRAEYKLIYFDKRGVAEPIRQLFYIAGVPFIDERVMQEEWKKAKNHTPFQQLPILEFNGVLLGQSRAIMRFLGRKFGLAGKNDVEEAIMDSLCERYGDFFNDVAPFIVVAEGYAKGDEKTLRDDILLPAVNRFFPCLEMFLKKTKGFLVGSKLSYVDILVTEGIAQIAEKEPRILDRHRRIEEYVKKIRKTPRLRDWLYDRPLTV